MKSIKNLWSGIVLLAVILGFSGGASGQNLSEESALELSWMKDCLPPLTYDKEQVRQARDQVKRVGWSEATIDAQMSASNQSEGELWALCLKAALFGEKARLERAVAALENSVGASDSNLDAETWMTVYPGLKAYDCLAACPEWDELDSPRKDGLREQLHARVLRFWDRRKTSEQNALYFSSFCLYAGLLAGATEYVGEALYGDHDEPGFEEIVARSVSPEGLIGEGDMREHLEAGRILLVACAALKSCSPDLASPIEPYAQKSLELVRDLTHPDGNFPSAIEPPPLNILVPFLERGGEMYAIAGLSEILSRIYKERPRSAESLLIGGSIEAKTAGEVSATTALPQTGAVVMHQSPGEIPLAVYMDTGLSGRGQSPAMLSLEWKDEFSPFADRFDSKGDHASNTVVVDRTLQPSAPTGKEEAQNGYIYSCKVFDDGAVYARAAAAGQYTERSAYPTGAASTPVLSYERILFLSSPFLIDLFRVRGGRVHDWMYHSPAGIESLIHGEWAPFNAPSGEYPWLIDSEEIVSAEMKGIYGVAFNPLPGSDIRRRLWMIDPAGSQLIAAKHGAGASLISRRTSAGDEGDLYVMIHERFKEKQPSNIQFEQLPLDPGVNRRGFQAFAFALIRGGEEHLYLFSLNPDVEFSSRYKGGKIVFQGNFAHVLLKEGKVQRMRLAGGGSLRYDAYGLQMDAALNFGVVRGVDSTDSIVDVDFTHPLPTGATLRSDLIQVLSTRSAPVMYRPLVIENINSSEGFQTVHLRHRPNSMSPQPGLGAEIEVGDQLFYENTAELTQTKDNLYTLKYTAPADVMIQGATDRNRVFFMKSNLLRKIRGESTAGAVQFHVEPKEGIDGRVEFYCIP
ncbi:MAG: hypothetical protein JXR73_23535 [Candidatus Omnitrophica bacterium]|nr:hypothetical protein [Candidatus Omnitrophota bacterium]